MRSQEAILRAQRRYNQSEKGRANRAEYAQSPTRKAVVRRYDKSEKGKVVALRYRKSGKRKAVLQRYYESGKGKETQGRYQVTAKGQASSARGAHKRRACMGAMSTLTASEWTAIKKRHKDKCVYCKRRMERLTMDHMVPLSRGGHHTAENVIPACRSCNSRRGNRPALLEMLVPSGQ